MGESKKPPPTVGAARAGTLVAIGSGGKETTIDSGFLLVLRTKKKDAVRHLAIICHKYRLFLVKRPYARAVRLERVSQV
jgi:hypothetical protein